jgi:hypothetical protein
MNDNYLWDRTGETDAEVQKLEELLGTLRYQPKPLPIPASIKIGRRSNYAPLAIAAALALLVLAAGIWLRVRTVQSTVPREAQRETRIEPVAPSTGAPIAPEAIAGTRETASPGHRRDGRVAVATIHKQRVRRQEPQLTAEELAQKEQLITALRLVSVKLNLAQRRSQGLAPTNIIRNQHRIG